jgi:putative ATP-binding cassette transporter
MNKEAIVNVKKRRLPVRLFLVIVLIAGSLLWGEKQAELDRTIRQLMEEGDIPGLSLVIVREDEEPLLKGYGYADLEQKSPVTADTRFELASCTKAFTALAALKLAEEGQISLDDPVSRYFPRFYATYEGKKYEITLRQLLHQTGGIPRKSIDRIPLGGGSRALEQTVDNLAGIELDHVPGTGFEYATVNYAVVGAVIEKASRMTYEEYMARNIFAPLGLTDTRVGRGQADPFMATGYKIGFFSPREYEAPVYRGNYPAGYVVANARDMAHWLKWQMGLTAGRADTGFYALLQQTHKRDTGVPPNRMELSAYAMGWHTHIDGNDLVYHDGLNPNFTCYAGFSPKEKVGVAVLANSNSRYTAAIGRAVMDFVRQGSGETMHIPHIQKESLDKASTMVCAVVCFYLLCLTLFFLSIPLDIVKGRRRFEGFSLVKLFKLPAGLLTLTPFLFAVNLIPRAMSGVSWKTALVWSPSSFQAAAMLLLAAIGLSYVGYVVSSLFPQKNKYLRSMPLIVVLSLLSGGANAMVIFLITSALFTRMELAYQLYFFGLSFFIYILGRKVVQTRLVRVTFDIVYDLRMRLIQKVFLTSYQRFEKLDRGRVYATLNDDTGRIGNLANLVVQLATNLITTLGAFLYLAAMNFWATLATLLVVAVVTSIHAVVSQRARVQLEEARDTQNVYMRLLNGLLDGFKELSLHANKKREYKADVEKSCDAYRIKIYTAIRKFINAFLVGESMLIIVLGMVGFGIPRIFPDISTFTLMSFIMIMLYLTGPVNGILRSIPEIMQIRVAWGRIRGFEKAIPANIDPGFLEEAYRRPGTVALLKAEGLEFEYDSENEEEKFKVGPIDLEFKSGEITFIIGGNGSGKTTLARLLTGLYRPDAGQVSIEGSAIEENHNGRLGEYFSTVFSNYHLFKKLYDVDLQGKGDQVKQYLDILRLQDKVSVNGDAFSTIDLSGGQRKRLALMQCYLEDSPIYLFDEIAADQDPEFRKFFYRDLLQRMKREGKIVVAITHDDHYFDAADKIVKMDMGKIDFVKAGSDQR